MERIVRLKFYAPLAAHNNDATRAKMLAFYETYMGAVVVKSNHHHTNMRLFNGIDFYICSSGQAPAFPGYHIIRFVDQEVAIFKEAVAKLREAADQGLINVSLDMYRGPWKTTLFEFTDPYRITWVLEVSSAVV